MKHIFFLYPELEHFAGENKMLTGAAVVTAGFLGKEIYDNYNEGDNQHRKHNGPHGHEQHQQHSPHVAHGQPGYGYEQQQHFDHNQGYPMPPNNF